MIGEQSSFSELLADHPRLVLVSVLLCPLLQLHHELEWHLHIHLVILKLCRDAPLVVMLHMDRLGAILPFDKGPHRLRCMVPRSHLSSFPDFKLH